MSRRINFIETWDKLSDTVEKVITAAPLARPVWNDKFSDIYSLCIAYPEALGENLYSATKSFLSAHVKKLSKDVHHCGEDFLTSYAKNWETYSQGAVYLNLLYHHFNHQYVTKSKQNDADIEYGFITDDKEQMLEIKDLAMEAWKEGMLVPLQHRLVNALLKDIAKDREGDLSGKNTKIHQVALYSLVAVEQHKKRNALKYYEDTFEKLFLQQTGEYYRAKALELLNDSTCSEYMNKVLSLLTDEEMRNRRFLHISSYKKTTLECQQRVIIDHIKFLQAGCRQMIRHNSTTDLLHMYMLLKSVANGLTHMVSELEAHIKETGLELVKGIKEGNIPLQFVETILEVHKRFHDLIRDTFNSDKLFVSALDRACIAAVNYSEPKQPCKAPELVSLIIITFNTSCTIPHFFVLGELRIQQQLAVCKYCDAILRRCAKGPSSDADDKLQSSILVFRYIDDKDVFQKVISLIPLWYFHSMWLCCIKPKHLASVLTYVASDIFYSRALAKRLVHTPCAMDMEEMMINRLKGVCGYDFTSKLHCMFTDVRLSTDLMQKYHQSSGKDGESPQTSINVNVLQAGAWPLSANQVEFVLPESLHKCLLHFEEFYNKKFNGRNLSWLHHLSQADVRINFTTKPYLFLLFIVQPFHNIYRTTPQPPSPVVQPNHFHSTKPYVTMSTFQLAVVILFNDATELSLSEISENTKLKSRDLERNVVALIDANILVKKEQEKKLDEHSVVCVNMKFSNKRTKFRVAFTQTQKEQVVEVQQTHSSVADDRKLYLQAAIVRIMKARKVLHHNSLMEEVINKSRIRFTPSVSAIKRSIEALIEKSYIERSPESPDQY
uniref:Cullin family profile domain-containing protein n=1 Tax=Ciona savignyi TaxID=51511 RepID=H2YFG2_CIOSA